MKKLIIKLLICGGIHLLYHLILILLAAWTETSLSHRTCFVIDLILLAALQIPLFMTYKIRPFDITAHKIIYWSVSLLLTFVSGWFWMYYIVGPLWKG